MSTRFSNLNRFLITIVAIFGIASDAKSDVLLSWNTSGNAGTETTEPFFTKDLNLSPLNTNLTLGTGVNSTLNGNRFGGSGWFNTGNDAAGSTLAQAVAGNDFISLTVTPNAGFQFTATEFKFIWDRSGTGPSAVTLRSSLDDYAADLASLSGLTTSTSSTPGFNANTLSTFRTLSFMGITNIATATTFRLYGYGATNSSGTGGFDTTSSNMIPNVELIGMTSAIAAPVPELGTLCSWSAICLCVSVYALRRRRLQAA